MLLDKIELYKVHHILKKVNKWAPIMRKISDEELQNQTKILREELKKGQTLKQILPRAYATVREADYRLLGMYPYDVQVMGAIILNDGNIAEMKTGEGKTLAATMPMYLNALSGKGSILVTPNSYLAQRDEEQLAPVYRWLGLTVSTGFRTITDKKKVSRHLKKSVCGTTVTFYILLLVSWLLTISSIIWLRMKKISISVRITMH